ncbi:MAG: hypothetical protein UGF89_02435 [Acutalibacteraceae bacterium]|nr:hypothetical protein [Acutalibacteraceae bacterium]
MKQKSNKKGMGVIIALSVAILLSVVVITIALVSMIKENGGISKNEDTSLYSLAGVTNPTKPAGESLNLFDSDATEEIGEDSLGADVTVADSFVNVDSGEIKTEPTTKADSYNPVEEYEKLSKNGDNILSDHHNNKYIKLVSEKYNVEKELLVAIYAEPDKGNNFVLEFSGKRDEDGNVIKSPDTLTKVYAIDKAKNIAVATGKATGNIGVSYAEGTLCFNMIKTIVMPQYPEYFTGVEK